jgi:hypothetical protein
MKRALAGLLLGLSVAWAALAAPALPEAGAMLQLEPAEFACLTPAAADRQPIEYPEGARRARLSGLVQVRLVFQHPQKPPRISFVTRAGVREFDDLVENYVSAYRLPCLREDADPVTATQEFEFKSDDGQPVVWRDLRGDGVDLQSEACRPRYPAKHPEFPRAAMDRGVRFAALLVKTTFHGPTQPPEVTMLHQEATHHFVTEVSRWASQIRLPCLKEDQVVSTAQVFTFALDSEGDIFLRDRTLQQLVPAIDKLDEQHVHFDFNAMGCPFDVRLRLFQPVMKNPVGEVGASDPRRAAFLDWLSGISLKLPPKVFSHVMGSTMTVSVPCTQLDLR